MLAGIRYSMPGFRGSMACVWHRRCSLSLLPKNLYRSEFVDLCDYSFSPQALLVAPSNVLRVLPDATRSQASSRADPLRLPPAEPGRMLHVFDLGVGRGHRHVLQCAKPHSGGAKRGALVPGNLVGLLVRRRGQQAREPVARSWWSWPVAHACSTL